MMRKSVIRFFRYLLQTSIDTWNIYTLELKRIFRDAGVMTLFFLASFAYPIIYNAMYYPNVLREVPVAVVDMDASTDSRDFIHKWDATSEVQVAYACQSMAEAEQLLKQQKIHAILYIPSGYAKTIAEGFETARLSLYCDMSSFLYMKNAYISANMVTLDLMNRVQVDRYQAMNMDETFAWSLVQGAPYESVTLFNPSTGYGSYLIPAVLVLIVHQTLFFGIGMLCGTAREENKEIFMLPGKRRRYSAFRLLLGRGAAYFVIYFAIAAYCLLLIPMLFDLPHVGNVWDLLRFFVPFLLATIYFSIFIGSFQKERESAMVTSLFSSLIFLFISGAVWPHENMSKIWVALSHLFPSTWAINGYVHIQSMGATLQTTYRDYYALWILAVFYFALCTISYIYRATKHDAAARKESIANRRRIRVASENIKRKYEEKKDKTILKIKKGADTSDSSAQKAPRHP